MNKPLKIVLLAAAAFYLALIAGTSFVIKGERYFTLVDDAMISMRYARNLAQGHGLTWNPGEPSSAQGFTNLGWTLYMAALHFLPLPASKISIAVMLSSALILLANVFAVAKVAAALAPDFDFAPLFAAITSAFYFPLVFWSLRGMEVGLLTLLLHLALLSVLRPTAGKRWLPGLILSLAVFVRLDALVAAAVVLAYLFFKDRRAFFLSAALVALTAAAVLYFQYAYYGDYLPTTYYQKMTGYSLYERARRGLLVFVQFASRDVLAPFLFSLAAVALYRQYNRETFLLLGIFLAQCAYSIYVGGDYAEPETNAANRFIAQGIPALLILLGWADGRLVSDFRKSAAPAIRPAVALSLVVLMIVSGEPWALSAIDSLPLLKSDVRRVRLALHVKANTQPEAVIAVHAAGQIPYYSERRVIDLLGLNDPRVAKGPGRGAFYPGHNKWNYEYSVGELRPDVIADNFAPLSEYMRRNPDYVFLDSDIYVRKDSALVNVEGMSSKSYR